MLKAVEVPWRLLYSRVTRLSFRKIRLMAVWKMNLRRIYPFLHYECYVLSGSLHFLKDTNAKQHNELFIYNCNKCYEWGVQISIRALKEETGLGKNFREDFLENKIQDIGTNYVCCLIRITRLGRIGSVGEIITK